MQISCEASRTSCSFTLVQDLQDLGIEPVVTPQLVRVAYVGEDEKLGNAILQRFQQEQDYGMVVKNPKPRKA